MTPLGNTAPNALAPADRHWLKGELVKLDRKVNNYLVQNGDVKQEIENLMAESEGLGLITEVAPDKELTGKIQQISSKIEYIRSYENFNKQIPLKPELKFINKHRAAHHLTFVRALRSIRLCLEDALSFIGNLGKSTYYKGLSSHKRLQVDNLKKELQIMKLKCQREETAQLNSPSRKTDTLRAEKKLVKLTEELNALNVNVIKYETKNDVRAAAKVANKSYQIGNHAIIELGNLTRELDKTIWAIKSIQNENSRSRIMAELKAEHAFQSELLAKNELMLSDLMKEAAMRRETLNEYLIMLEDCDKFLAGLRA